MNCADSLKVCESKAEVSTYLCYAFAKSSLLEVRAWINDDDRFLDFVQKFAGSKLSVNQRRLTTVVWRYRMAVSYRRYHTLYRLKKFDEARQAERDFLRIAGLSNSGQCHGYEKRIAEARRALADVIRSRRWNDRLKSVKSRRQFIEEEDLRLGYAHQVYRELVGK